MTCKLHVKVWITCGSSTVSVNGFLHPRRCMGARYSHLDLKPMGAACALEDIVRVKGVKLPCEAVEGLLVIRIPELDTEVRLSVEGFQLECRGFIYAMRSRSGLLYLGPLAWRELRQQHRRF